MMVERVRNYGIVVFLIVLLLFSVGSVAYALVVFKGHQKSNCVHSGGTWVQNHCYSGGTP